MATTTELAERLLRKLGVLGGGEAPSADDGAVAEEKIVAVHEAVTALGRANWPVDEVPPYAIEPYTLMGTVLAGPDFGRPVDTGAWVMGLRMLAAGSAAAVSKCPIHAEYF